MPNRVRIILSIHGKGILTGRAAIALLDYRTTHIRKEKDETYWQYAKRAWNHIPDKADLKLWIIREPRGTKGARSLYSKTLWELGVYPKRPRITDAQIWDNIFPPPPPPASWTTIRPIRLDSMAPSPNLERNTMELPNDD